MPEIVLYVKPGSHVSVTRQREQLAVELAQNVRAMVAKAGSDVGVPWSEDHMDVDIVLRHADAVNVAGLAITVALSPGADNTVFDARYAIREALRVSVVGQQKCGIGSRTPCPTGLILTCVCALPSPPV